MEQKVKTKFKLGDQFLFKAGSWTYTEENIGEYEVIADNLSNKEKQKLLKLLMKDAKK